MIRDCPHCGFTYDDIYRFTHCPNVTFLMSTHVMRGDGVERHCTSIRELKQFMAYEIGAKDDD